jgi:hypothetical protein
MMSSLGGYLCPETGERLLAPWHPREETAADQA